MIKAEYYIGIDPDVDKSGFALWDGAAKAYVEMKCLTLWDMFAELKRLHGDHPVLIRLEAGWKAKGLNWHRGGNRSGNDVGRNHEIGRQIEKFCRAESIPYVLIEPKGYSGYDHDVFCAITNWPKKVKTNSETRVAGMLVYGC